MKEEYSERRNEEKKHELDLEIMTREFIPKKFIFKEIEVNKSM
jgi:hypothetical protein